MSEEEVVPAKKSHAFELAALGASLIMLGLAWYLTRKPCPCAEHTDGEGPILKVAKASAEMATAAVPEDPPEEPRSTAPGGPPLVLGEPASFNPQPTDLPKPDAAPSNGRRTRK
jgi:hypothetical protein